MKTLKSSTLYSHFSLDCLSSLGVADRSVIPDSRISASSHLQGYSAKEARLHSLKGWCAAKKDKKQFIQIDLGQVNTHVVSF